jgi:hypothetical protein
VKSVGEKISASGYGSVAIQTEFITSYQYEPSVTINNVSIISNNANAWYQYLKEVWNFQVSKQGNSVSIQFNGANPELWISEIAVQVGPGWIETI